MASLLDDGPPLLLSNSNGHGQAGSSSVQSSDTPSVSSWTPQEFYDAIDELLQSPLEVPQVFLADSSTDDDVRIHAAVFDKLQRFAGLLEEGYDKFLEHQYNADHCISRLMESAFFREHRDEVAACIIDVLGRAKSLPGLLIAYDLLMAYGELDASIFRMVHSDVSGLARDKIARLVHLTWAGHYAAVAEAQIQGSSSLLPRPAHASTIRSLEDSAAAPGWGGATFDESSGNASETLEGHPIARMVATQGSSSSVARTNASKVRSYQMKLRDKAFQILYEVCRVQRLEPIDMRAVDEKFINHLFDLVEETRLHEDEAFNYLLIKLIAALNEQFMVTSISTAGEASSSSSLVSPASEKNKVMLCIHNRLHVTKTFGENIIFMLNRASSDSAEDICMQLLLLKLLYLLFTNSETCHYFYTNDLKVLVDVFIRELSDLPEEAESLRHTFLRVLHPLLTHTQLVDVPYKRPQIRRLLRAMVKDSLYRGDISATTRRLVERCLRAQWCQDLDRLDPDFIRPPEAKEDGSNQNTSRQEDVVPHANGAIPDEPNEPSMSDVSPRPQGRLSLTTHNGGTFLRAERFNNVIARSVPSSPPPKEDAAAESALKSASLLERTTSYQQAQDDAAMALADGMPVHQQGVDRSWQSQVAQTEHILDPDVNPTESLLSARRPSPIRQKSLARRASHDEVSKSAGRRRPPPAPPRGSGSEASGSFVSHHIDGLPNSAIEEGHSRQDPSTLQILRQELDDQPTAEEALPTNDASIPSVQVDDNTVEHTGAEEICGASSPLPGRRRPPAIPAWALAASPSGRNSPAASPSTDGDYDAAVERMTQSMNSLEASQQPALTPPLQSVHMARASSSSLSHPLAGALGNRTPTKQRRAPPAPPSLAASTPHQYIDDVSSAPVLGAFDGSKLRDEDGETLRRKMYLSQADPSYLYDGGSDLSLPSSAPPRAQTAVTRSSSSDSINADSMQGSGDSYAGSVVSAGGRRRPPPPPVDRSTKAASLSRC